MPSRFSTGATRILKLLLPFLLSLTSAWAAPSFRVLHTFAGGTDGAYPIVPVIDRSGNLFGLTGQGGSLTDCGTFGCGTGFELSPKNAQWKESIFYSFSSTTAIYPNSEGPIVMDSHGSIYGVGQSGSCGCGVIYQLARSSGAWTANVLYEFADSSSGYNPSSGLIQDAAGNLYGATYQGGASNFGVIFEISPAAGGSWTYNVLYNFGTNGGYSDGQQPGGGLALDSAGNIYGTTSYGGEYGHGSVFKLAPSGTAWIETVLHNFSLEYGDTPQPYGVVVDATGSLYGITTTGGAYSLGTIYKLTPAIGYWNLTVLFTFTGSNDGAYPFGALTIGPSGALYGVATQGGSHNYGNVYELALTNGRWRQTVLHAFTNGFDGGRPSVGITLDTQGNIFGETADGGTSNFGVVFEITP